MRVDNVQSISSTPKHNERDNISADLCILYLLNNNTSSRQNSYVVGRENRVLYVVILDTVCDIERDVNRYTGLRDK